MSAYSWEMKRASLGAVTAASIEVYRGDPNAYVLVGDLDEQQSSVLTVDECRQLAAALTAAANMIETGQE